MYCHWLRITDDKGTQDFVLEDAFYSLGRDLECSIRINSRFVSRHHAILQLYYDGNNNHYYEIEDGDGKGKLSANGLLINDQKQQKHTLKDGDKIVFGPEVFAVYYHRDPEINAKSFKTFNFLEYETDTTQQFEVYQ